MKKPIYVIGGSKGGVGKSMVSSGVINMLISMGEDVLVVESDTSNPDVWKMHKDELTTELIDLDDANGWIDLVNVCEQNAEKAVVVNTAARNNKGVTAYGETLGNTLEELKRDLVTLWVINRQRDSLELLKEFMDALPTSRIHVIRNGYFGDESKFELYNNSKIRKAVEEAGGKSLTLPDLADRVSDDLYSKRLSIDAAMRTLPLGNRAELTRWRNEARKVLSGVVNE